MPVDLPDDTGAHDAIAVTEKGCRDWTLLTIGSRSGHGEGRQRDQALE
jgi:hypothetical protein